MISGMNGGVMWWVAGLVDKMIELPADDKFPDCPFIEDTAVVIGNRAFITHPVSAHFHILLPYLSLTRILFFKESWP
jgi:hypothetical protein